MTDVRSVTMTKQGEPPAVQAPGRIPDRPGADCLDVPPAERSRPAVPRRAAFWLLALVFAATMLGTTTLPTPLYDIYQAQWHFAAPMGGGPFAVSAAGVLLPLLRTGRASAQAGRKPVLAAAL